MADILIVGSKPKSKMGKEFFLHSTDWWYEILDVLDAILPEEDSLDNFLVTECLLCPRTPFLEYGESLMFGEILEKHLTDNKVRSFLMKLYQENQMYIDYFESDLEYMENSVQERIDQINEFINFLKECGGCRAKWYGMG